MELVLVIPYFDFLAIFNRNFELLLIVLYEGHKCFNFDRDLKILAFGFLHQFFWKTAFLQNLCFEPQFRQLEYMNHLKKQTIKIFKVTEFIFSPNINKFTNPNFLWKLLQKVQIGFRPFICLAGAYNYTNQLWMEFDLSTHPGFQSLKFLAFPQHFSKVKFLNFSKFNISFFYFCSQNKFLNFFLNFILLKFSKLNWMNFAKNDDHFSI